MEGRVSDTVQTTYDKSYKELIKNLDIIFYTYPVKLEDDGERSTNAEFITGIQTMFENIIWDMEIYDESPLVIHLQGDVETRFNDIKLAIKQHEHTPIG